MSGRAWTLLASLCFIAFPATVSGQEAPDQEDEAAAEASDESFDETSDESFDESSDESIDEASDESIDEPSDESADEAGDASSDEASDEFADEASEDSRNESSGESDGEADVVAVGPASPAPSAADTPAAPKSPQSPAAARWVTVVNSGGFLIRAKVAWPGGGDSWQGSASSSKRFEIPGDVQSVELTVENETGLVWQPQKLIYKGPAQPGTCFVARGATLSSNGAFEACP